MGLFRQSLIIIFILTILTLNVAAENRILEKLRSLEDKLKAEPTDTCSIRCNAVKNACASKCNKFSYSVCRNNCFGQASKCRQDCKGLNLLEPKLKQGKKIENLFLKLRAS